MSFDGLNLFSDNYEEGRIKFHEICKANNYEIKSFIHPDLKSEKGLDLAIDVVWIGNENASKVLWLSCGTHGLEAAAGAATIMQFLAKSPDNIIGDDFAIIIVFSINPYGWAYSNRGNENGIDLNRNYLDHSKPHPNNEAYKDLHDAVKETIPTDDELDGFIKKFYEIGVKKGFNHIVNGITAGQYSYDDGLSFGGNELSWSCSILNQIADTYFKYAKKVILIDWHTGIGEYGKPLFIFDGEKNNPKYEIASKIWPNHNIFCNDMIDGASVEYSGLIATGLSGKISAQNNAEVIAITIEWGTYEVNKMIQALIMDNWLHNNRNHTDRKFLFDVKNKLEERFYPSDIFWRQSVLEYAPSILDDVIKFFLI